MLMMVYILLCPEVSGSMHCDWPPDSEAFGFGFPTPLSSVLPSSASCPCHCDCFGLSGNTVTLNLFELEQSFKILFLFM